MLSCPEILIRIHRLAGYGYIDLYIVSIFIAVINTLLNSHEKVSTCLAFIESQIFLPVFISSKNSFSYNSDPV